MYTYIKEYHIKITLVIRKDFLHTVTFPLFSHNLRLHKVIMDHI